MKTLLLIFIFVLSTSNAFAESKMISKKEIEAMEAEAQKQLQSRNLDNKTKLLAYLLAGREFYQYRYFDKSKKYYQGALKVDTNENKSEAYINLMAIALIEKDKGSLEDVFKQAEVYFKKNPAKNTKEVKYYMDSISSYLSGKKNPDIKGYYAHFLSEENLISLVKNKEYQKALSTLNPAALEQSDNSADAVLYDALNVSVHKKNVKNLYCEKELKQYPDAYTYTVLICGLLNDYLTTAKFDEKRLARAERYFAEEKSRMYLLEMVKEIKE
jgi:hypothetical protein